VGYGAEGASMPTPSINAIKSLFSFLIRFFIPFIVERVLSHVEPLLHQSFTIVVRAEVFLWLSFTFGGECCNDKTVMLCLGRVQLLRRKLVMLCLDL